MCIAAAAPVQAGCIAHVVSSVRSKQQDNNTKITGSQNTKLDTVILFRNTILLRGTHDFTCEYLVLNRTEYELALGQRTIARGQLC